VRLCVRWRAVWCLRFSVLACNSGSGLGLLFVTAVGLGSLAGTLALAVAYAGVLGRVYADAFADVDPRPLEALQSTGATRGQIFLRGIWPQARPTVTAYTIYSFECCVRAASVLGFVGAGGIGYEISLSMRLFEYGQAMTLILVFVLLLASTDLVSRRLRRSLEPNPGKRKSLGACKELRPRSMRVLLQDLKGSIPSCRRDIGCEFLFRGFTREHFGDAHVLGNMLRFCRGMFPLDCGRTF